MSGPQGKGEVDYFPCPTKEVVCKRKKETTRKDSSLFTYETSFGKPFVHGESLDFPEGAYGPLIGTTPGPPYRLD